MTTPSYPPVQAVSAFTIPGPDGAFRTDPIVLFTVPLGIPARIDSVYMQAVGTTDATFQRETWGLVLAAPGGAVQAQVWTPPLDIGEQTGNIPQALLTWMVGGVGTDQLATQQVILTSLDGADTVTLDATLALPDVVLQPNATVAIIRACPAGADDVNVTVCTVTYTPNAGAVSTTEELDLTPYLLPTANS